MTMDPWLFHLLYTVPVCILWAYLAYVVVGALCRRRGAGKLPVGYQPGTGDHAPDNPPNQGSAGFRGYKSARMLAREQAGQRPAPPANTPSAKGDAPNRNDT